MRRIQPKGINIGMSYPINESEQIITQATEKHVFNGSQVPISKDYINWTPSISDNVSTPTGFLEGNLLSKAFSIQTITLPNSSLPFFIPLIRQPTAMQYTPANTNYNYATGISQMDYFMVVRGYTTDLNVYVIYFNYQNNYSIPAPGISSITNSTTVNYPYYYCYDFVMDFLLLLQEQINAALQGFLTLPACNFSFIGGSNALQLSFTQAFLNNYYVEISPNLKNLLNFRAATINLGNFTTYRLLFNNQVVSINNVLCLSSYVKINTANILFFKSIFICSNNFEISNMKFHSNSLQQTNTNVSTLPPLTSIFVFKYTGQGVSFDEPFTFSNLTPINTSVRFNYDEYKSDCFKLQVLLQLQDNITFIPYIFGNNDCIDMLILTYLR